MGKGRASGAGSSPADAAARAVDGVFFTPAAVNRLCTAWMPLDGHPAPRPVSHGLGSSRLTSAPPGTRRQLKLIPPPGGPGCLMLRDA